MSDSYKKMKLRLLNCAGLGLEQGESLLKITTDSFETRFEANVAYLLDEKGKIKCTLISSKSEYESDANVDRRHTNLSNGFEIYWDGDLCTVFNKAKKKEKKGIIPKINLPEINLPENLRNKRLWIGSGVAVAVIALIIILICLPSGNEPNTTYSDPEQPYDYSTVPRPMPGKNLPIAVALELQMPNSNLPEKLRHPKIETDNDGLIKSDGEKLDILWDNELYEHFEQENRSRALELYIGYLFKTPFSLTWEDGEYTYTEEFKLPTMLPDDKDKGTPLRECLGKNLMTYYGDKKPQSIKLYFYGGLKIAKVYDDLEYRLRKGELSSQDISQAKKVADEYPVLIPTLKKLLAPKVSSTYIYNQYVEKLEGTPLFDENVKTRFSKETKAKTEMKEGASSPSGSKGAASANSSKDNEVSALVAKLILKLSDVNCTRQTLKEVEAAYNKLSPKEKDFYAYSLKEHIEQYKTFFNAKNMDDLRNLNQKYFSYLQKKVIWGNGGYLSSAANFKNLYSKYGMDFWNPICSGQIEK